MNGGSACWAQHRPKGRLLPCGLKQPPLACAHDMQRNDKTKDAIPGPGPSLSNQPTHTQQAYRATHSRWPAMHVCRHTVAAASRAADQTGPTTCVPLLGCRTCAVAGALNAGAAGAMLADTARRSGMQHYAGHNSPKAGTGRKRLQCLIHPLLQPTHLPNQISPFQTAHRS